MTQCQLSMCMSSHDNNSGMNQWQQKRVCAWAAMTKTMLFDEKLDQNRKKCIEKPL